MSTEIKKMALSVAADELQRCDDMAQMVLDREWAEHAGKEAVSSKVEEAFTQLHNENSTAVSIRDHVIGDMQRALLLIKSLPQTPETQAFLAEHEQTYSSDVPYESADSFDLISHMQAVGWRDEDGTGQIVNENVTDESFPGWAAAIKSCIEVASEV